MDTIAVCSCGVRVPLPDVEAHAASHGLEGDTYTAAQLRQWVADMKKAPPAEAEGGASDGLGED